MFFKQMKVGTWENFCYFIGDEENKVVALVDPAWEPDNIIEVAKKEGFEKFIVILTHTHPDHINSIDLLISKVDPTIYVHELEADAVSGFSDKIKKVKDNDIIEVGSIKMKVLHTPGHTPGGVCLYFDDILITGDTLFIGAAGRTDFPGGDINKLRESLKRLSELPDDTKVYTGHDYSGETVSTIKKEKDTNPYMQNL